MQEIKVCPKCKDRAGECFARTAGRCSILKEGKTYTEGKCPFKKATKDGKVCAGANGERRC